MGLEQLTQERGQRELHLVTMEYDPVMAQLLFRPATSHKRGSRHFGAVLIPVPAIPTEFELYAQQLGLTPGSYVSSAQLRIWCRHHKDRCYIPEWLLAEWGMKVDPFVKKP